MQKKMADVHPLITISGSSSGAAALFGFMSVIFGPLMLAMFVFCVNVFKRRYLDASFPTGNCSTRRQIGRMIVLFPRLFTEKRPGRFLKIPRKKVTHIREGLLPLLFE